MNHRFLILKLESFIMMYLIIVFYSHYLADFILLNLCILKNYYLFDQLILVVLFMPFDP
jgi:hypothetical protein